MDLIVLAVPVFVVSLLAEAGVIAWVLKRKYSVPDAMASMGTGIIEQLVSALIVLGPTLLLYTWLYEHASITHLDGGAAWVIVVATLVVDFLYYWWHHISHKVQWVWAGHVLHHQSDRYNLSTALRQSPLATLTGNLFYLPMAIVGFPPAVFITARAIMTLYQFWIHTELVPRMPRFERVLNSPSLHRVHHAINPRYLDKNFGGILTIWDRIFGTFEPETERPAYGVLKPYRSFNSAWAHVDPWLYLAAVTRKLGGGPVNALRVLWADPAHTPGADSGDLDQLYREVSAVRLEPRTSLKVTLYALSQFLIVLAVGSYGLNHQTEYAFGFKAAVVVWVIGSLGSIGAICDQRPWAIRVEVARLLVTAVAAGAYLTGLW